MKVPYRPLSFPRAVRKYKYIIIHDTTCSFENYEMLTLDTKKSQTNDARTYQWIINGYHDLNFHFMVERVGEDYETILCRPLDRLCEFPDIPSVYSYAIHVCVMGNFNYEKAPQRLYDHLIYRILGPQSFWFRIQPSNILFHSDVSTEEKNQCPGIMFDKARLMAKYKTLAPR